MLAIKDEPRSPAWQRLLHRLDLGADFVLSATVVVALITSAVLMIGG